MFGMDIIASCTADYRRYEGFAATAASMHIKSDDTQRVPQNQHNGRTLCQQIFHINLQRYKIPFKYYNFNI